MSNQYLLYQILLEFDDNFVKYRKDISALLLTWDNYLWLGSDETSSIERLCLLEPQKFAAHKQFRVAEFMNLPAPEDEEIDIEGIAYSDYYLWFTGSHSYKRKKPKPKKSDLENIERLARIVPEKNRYILGRIPLVNGELLKSCPHPKNPDLQLSAGKLELTCQGNLLMNALINDVHLGDFIQAKIPGKENGFDVEGIAVIQNKIFLGLRGPVLRGWGVMLEIELADSTPGNLILKEFGEDGHRYKKHFIFLNGLGIRDLCWDGEDLLILAGPTMDLDGPVQVYRLRNGVNLSANQLHKPELVLEIPFGKGEEHAEGMTLFNNIAGVPSILVVYDSPAKSRLVGDTGLIADVFTFG
ncbi:MAG: DUF3616 domain-containing protein [Nostocaceae cyanobacterium]|nr:DUF3616 domain-containing protein [Nostocaceae cyanobacterium]